MTHPFIDSFMWWGEEYKKILKPAYLPYPKRSTQIKNKRRNRMNKGKRR